MGSDVLSCAWVEMDNELSTTLHRLSLASGVLAAVAALVLVGLLCGL